MNVKGNSLRFAWFHFFLVIFCCKIAAILDTCPSKRAQRPFDSNDLPFANLGPVPDHEPRLAAGQFVEVLAVPAEVDADLGDDWMAQKQSAAIVAAGLIHDYLDPLDRGTPIAKSRG